ncbi:MAG: hypothetical protein WBL95_04495 [Microcoleus sp.]
MAKSKAIFGVEIESTALALSTEMVKPNSWMQATMGQVASAIDKGVKSVKTLGQQMIDGGKEVISAIGRGDLKLFWDFLKDDPVAALAGTGAVAATGYLLFQVGAAVGGAIVATRLGAAAAGRLAVAAGGIGTMWAAIKSATIGSVTVGALLPSIQQAVVSSTQTIMNVDWLKSDKSILAELESAYLGFLNNIGESAGRMLIAIVLGGARANPRLTLNITAAAALSITKEIEDGNDISSALIEDMANIANLFLRYARNLAGRLAYLELRKYSRENIRTGNAAIDKKIQNWGLIEGETFTINGAIDAKIEKIKEWNKGVGEFAEGFKEGMSDGFNELVIMV